MKYYESLLWLKTEIGGEQIVKLKMNPDAGSLVALPVLPTATKLGTKLPTTLPKSVESVLTSVKFKTNLFFF